MGACFAHTKTNTNINTNKNKNVNQQIYISQQQKVTDTDRAIITVDNQTTKLQKQLQLCIEKSRVNNEKAAEYIRSNNMLMAKACFANKKLNEERLKLLQNMLQSSQQLLYNLRTKQATQESLEIFKKGSEQLKDLPKIMEDLDEALNTCQEHNMITDEMQRMMNSTVQSQLEDPMLNSEFDNLVRMVQTEEGVATITTLPAVPIRQTTVTPIRSDAKITVKPATIEDDDNYVIA